MLRADLQAALVIGCRSALERVGEQLVLICRLVKNQYFVSHPYADDLVSVGIETCFERLPRYDPTVGSPSAAVNFFYKIARNAMTTAVREIQKREKVELLHDDSDPEWLAPVGTTPTNVLTYRQVLEALLGDPLPLRWACGTQ